MGHDYVWLREGGKMPKSQLFCMGIVFVYYCFFVFMERKNTLFGVCTTSIIGSHISYEHDEVLIFNVSEGTKFCLQKYQNQVALI